MAEKVARLRIKREKDMMYFIKDGAVWKVPRKEPGQPKGRQQKVADGGFEQDHHFIYFLDKDGDVSRAARAVDGQKRAKRAKKAKAKNTRKAGRPTKKKVARKAAATRPKKAPRKAAAASPKTNLGKVEAARSTGLRGPASTRRPRGMSTGPAQVVTKLLCVKCGQITPVDVAEGPGMDWTCSRCDAPLVVAERFVPRASLGAGGCGEAFLALDLDNPHRAEVVIKLARPEEEYQKVLANEFKVNSALAHHNICKYFDYLEDARLGRWLIVMEYGGDSVAKLIQRHKAFELDEALFIIGEAAKALDYAHDQGFIHHDVTPGNILVAGERDSRRVRVADFGTAVTSHPAFTTRGRGTRVADARIGYTHCYVAPEVALGMEAHTKSDQYCLALVLTSMLLGEVFLTPYRPTGPLPGISEAQDLVVTRALSWEPGARYPRCVEFANALKS
jgi:hypothetical protein